MAEEIGALAAVSLSVCIVVPIAEDASAFRMNHVFHVAHNGNSAQEIFGCHGSTTRSNADYTMCAMSISSNKV